MERKSKVGRAPPAARPLNVGTGDAARLLLHAQALAPEPPVATPNAVASLIERMGFVQIDTISTVERAHHLILAARLKGYRPQMLTRVLETDRKLFEHWTHDASIIPLKWFPHWRHRFQRSNNRRWHRNQLGQDADRVLAFVLDRITREGPLASRDFEHVGEKTKTQWWGWKPHKIALDYLWRTGHLHVTARQNFHKVYDLTERVIAKHSALPQPAEQEHVDWACRTALERLGTATLREIAQFWAAVSLEQVKLWIKGMRAAGEVIDVMIESADGSEPRPGYAFANVRQRIAKTPAPPDGVRLLCPFDPVLRDRARAKRLFNFDFRFEGFVPSAQRKHGYYVMAILEGDRFVGKLDPKFDRAAGVLRIGKIWWEAGIRVTKKRRGLLDEGIEKLARWIGAKGIEYRE